MSSLKKSVVIGLSAASLGLAGIGGITAVSAATTTDGSESNSIVDKIATKFGLNKDEVKAVFETDRADHQKEMKEKQTTKLAEAVSNGTITQAQADHISDAWAEIEALRGESASPQDESDDTRAAIREKRDALKTWAREQDIDLKLIGGFGGHGLGGPGMDREKPTDAPTANS